MGETDQNLITGLDEHGNKPDQPVNQCLSNCAKLNNSIKFFELPHVNRINTIVSEQLHLHNAVLGNCEILDYNNNQGQLQYLEANCIKNTES